MWIPMFRVFRTLKRGALYNYLNRVLETKRFPPYKPPSKSAAILGARQVLGSMPYAP